MVSNGDGGREKNGAQVAGGEGVQGAQAAFEFDGRDAALAEEAAQKIVGGHFSLLRIAFDAAGNEVSVAIVASAGQRDDVVEDSPTHGEAPETVKAAAAFALVKGVAPAADLQEVQFLEVGAAAVSGETERHGTVERGVLNLVWQKDLGEVAGLRAVKETHSALGRQAADGLADGAVRKVDAAREQVHGKTKLALAFETAMAEEMGVNHALREIEAEARNQNIITSSSCFQRR